MPRCGDCGPGNAVLLADPASPIDVLGVGTPDDPYILDFQPGENIVFGLVEIGSDYPIRPDGAQVVIWIGPDNPEALMGDLDIWIDTAAEPLDETGIIDLIENPGSALAIALAQFTKPRSYELLDAARIIPTVGATGPQAFGSGSGTYTPCIVFPKAGGNTWASALFVVPRGVTTADLTLLWAPSTDATTVVHWTATYKVLTGGTNAMVSGTTISSINSTCVSGGQEVSGDFGTFPVTPGQLVRVNIGRLGGNTADTYPADALLTVLQVNYT